MVDGITASGNGLTTDQAGVDIFDSDHLTLARNTVFANGDIGFFVSGLDDGRFVGNRIADHPETGILLDHGTGTSSATTASRTTRTASSSRATGTPSPETGCPAPVMPGGVRLRHLSRGRDRQRDREQHRAELPPGRHARRRLRRVRGPADGREHDQVERRPRRDGRRPARRVHGLHTLLQRNIAIGAGDDGIDVDNAATTLTGNLAFRNGDLGIEAVAGITHGGANKAAANGNPAQRTNVVC
jgi:Right handed beta helix region